MIVFFLLTSISASFLNPITKVVDLEMILNTENNFLFHAFYMLLQLA